MIFRGQSGEILHYLPKSRPIDIRSHFVRCLSFMKMCSLFKCWYAAATANQSANGKNRFGIKLPILMLLPHVHFICRKLWLGLAQSHKLTKLYKWFNSFVSFFHLWHRRVAIHNWHIHQICWMVKQKRNRERKKPSRAQFYALIIFSSNL